TPVVEIATSTVKVNNVTVASGAASGAVALAVGVNTINVVVTAEDSVTVKTYTLSVTRQGAGDANLSNLVLSTGAMDQGFVATTTGYSQTVANTVTSLTITPTLADSNASVKVNNVAVPSGNASGSIALTVGTNPINVLVTAQDGVTQKNYLVTVTRQANTDATLSGLSLSSGSLSPVFASGTLSYTASVANTTSQITLTATANNANYQSITVNNNPVTSGLSSGWVSLAVGSNTIDIVVTAQDGQTVKNYSVVVTRAASTNANLSALSLSTGTLSPVFASATTAYTVTVANATSSVQFVATAEDSNYSSLKVNNVAATSGLASAAVSLAVGDNAIPVQVIAQDGTTTKTYTVTIHRKSADANLSGLSLSSGSLSPVFAGGTTGYTASVANGVSNLTVTATASDAANITGLTINGVAATSGVASGAINLVVGANAIPVVVTAEDSTVTKTYTVTVTRLPVAGSDATLSSLVPSTGALDQIFQSSSTAYTMSVDYFATTLAVTPTMSDPLATMTVNGQAVTDATLSQSVALTAGAVTSINVVVTAQDLVTTKTYTIDVTRQAAASFAQRAYIKASNSETLDEFGTAVAISGNTMVVGAPFEDSAATGIDGNQVDDCGTTNLNCASNSGAVYVFVKDSVTGLWSQQAYIKAPDTDLDDNFGYAVDIEGDTILVGAPREDSNVTNVTNAAGFPAAWNDSTKGSSGAVYVYKRTGTAWALEAFLKASNTTNGDRFGISVALSGNHAAVGAYYQGTTAVQSGAAYTFTRSGSIWSAGEFLKATSPATSDEFGFELGLSGDTLVVGAPLENVGGSSNVGAAYVFTYNGATCGSPTRLQASDANINDQFGHAIDIKGDMLIIASPHEASILTDTTKEWKYGAGTVYAFTRSGGVWTEIQRIRANTPTEVEANDFFGRSLALGDGVLVITAPGEDSAATTVGGSQADNTSLQSGAAYVLVWNGTSWVHNKFVKVINNTAGDELGGPIGTNYPSVGVDVDGSVMVVGSRLEDGSNTGVNNDPLAATYDDAAASAGAAYIFQ
ncbi:MAG: cadherin-like beta sandwich domain-containing protein, partial [Gammaproteobacteria bacterium]|nr:cadherin-like beta sandwich domain-containing protein [Gammaproteobacteria bacterium]